jgi:hypothetical protein
MPHGLLQSLLDKQQSQGTGFSTCCCTEPQQHARGLLSGVLARLRAAYALWLCASRS